MLSGLVLFLFGVPVLIVLFRSRTPRVGTRRAWLELAFGVYLLMLVSVVLFPLRIAPGLRADDAVWDYASFLANWVNLTPFASIAQMLDRPSRTQALRQIGGNMLLLAPLGVLLPALTTRMRKATTVLATITMTAVGIEVVQYLARIARLSLRSVDVDDAILNVAGGVVGFLVWAVWSRLVGPRLTGAAPATQRGSVARAQQRQTEAGGFAVKRLAVAAAASLVLVLIAYALSSLSLPAPLALPVFIVLEPPVILAYSLTRLTGALPYLLVAWLIWTAFFYLALAATALIRVRLFSPKTHG